MAGDGHRTAASRRLTPLGRWTGRDWSMAETRMTKKEREKRRRVLLWIFLPLVVLLLVFSGLVPSVSR